jgi:hypothetical protein
MPMLTTCAYCGETFDGRIDQIYCSSNHRINAYRKRVKEEKIELASTKKPILFDFIPPLTPAEKENPSICEELNILYTAMEVAQTMYTLEGEWEYTHLKDTLSELLFYDSFSNKLLERMQNNYFSEDFYIYLQPHVEKIARFYKQVAKKCRQLIRKYKEASKVGEVMVELEPAFKQKIKTQEEICIKMWMEYKDLFFSFPRSVTA